MRNLRVRCALAAMLWAGAMPASADPDRTAPTVAELLAPAALTQPQLSPDGALVVAQLGEGTASRLAVFDLARPGATPAPIALPAGERLDWVIWLAPGRLLASLAKGSDAATTRLVQIAVGSGQVTQLGPVRAAGQSEEVLHLDRPAGFLLLKSQVSVDAAPAVYRVDLVTGAVTLAVAAQPGVRDWVVDAAGVVRAGIGERGEKSWLVYRSGEGARFSRSSRGAGDSNSGIEQILPVRGSDQGYALAETRAGRIGLFAYDFRRSRLGTLLYENGRADLDGFEVGKDGALLGVQFTDDRERALWFDPALAARQTRLDTALPGRVNRVVSAGDDGRRLLVHSASASDPGAYYLFDGSAVHRFAAINPALDGRRLSPVLPVHYAARDGLGIDGYLTLPAGKPDKALPLIVMPHGGPFARDGWDYDPWVQYLAARGYAVLQANYRGSTGFGRTMTDRGDGEWGRAMQDDVDDGVQWLAGQGTIDPRRVCILGASYGGYAAMWAAARANPLYRCAISFAGISDVRAQLDFDHRTFEERDFRAWRRRIQGHAPSLDSLSPITFVGGLTMPILIAHGTADQTVPVDQSERLDAALTRLGRAHEFVVYPGEDHTLRDPAHEADFLARVGAFLDKHNPG
jgi:dipeptidyl aminopeptidase/acylaminoacyl peptidase